MVRPNGSRGVLSMALSRPDQMPQSAHCLPDFGHLANGRSRSATTRIYPNQPSVFMPLGNRRKRVWRKIVAEAQHNLGLRFDTAPRVDEPAFRSRLECDRACSCLDSSRLRARN